MQTAEDAARIKEIGAPSERVGVTGNVKYDRTVDAGGCKRFGYFRRSDKDVVVVCGSTHPGEEDAIMGAYKRAFERDNRLRLVIAPRHVERSRRVCRAVEDAGFSALTVSAAAKSAACEKTVFVVDTMGILIKIYEESDIVFIGGSLVKKGGHNIIEPASLMKPVVFGPHMENFRDMSARFLEKDAAVAVENADGLMDALIALSTDRQRMKALGERAYGIVIENKGAVDRTLDAIESETGRF